MAAGVKPRGQGAHPAKGDTQADHRQPLPLHAGARLTARVALAIVLLGLTLWIASDFLPALIWAAILAITAWPLHVRLSALLARGPSTVSALLVTSAVALTVFLPLGLAAYQLAQHNEALVNWIAQARQNGIEVPEWVARLPIATDAVREWWQSNLSDPHAATAWLKGLNADKASELVTTLGGQLLHRTFMFAVALISLFVLLINGRKLGQQILLTADRIFGDPGEELAGKMVDAVRGTVNGTIVVAVAEGLLIGAGYVLAGVPNAIVFTILTIAFAMLPFGAWAAFTAAALALGVSGGPVWIAIAVFVWGAVVMLAGDHFVWPTLVGGAARLPFLLAFVGIFGGLATLGLLGLFLGPVLMAAMLTIWREWVVMAPPQARKIPAGQKG